jgi:hypothetical protein
VAVVAVVVVSTGAFVLANRNEGSADPEAAARVFLDAALARDARGVLAASMPAERDALTAHLPAIAEQLERLGLVGAVDLGRVASGEVVGRDLRVRSERVDVDTFRVVVDGGTISGRWSSDPLALSDRLQRFVVDDLGLDPPRPGEEFSIDLARSPLTLMSVRELGGWHISLYETFAETWRIAADAPQTSFGRGPVATGAGTPEAVVGDLLDAGARLDATRAVTLAYPPEMRALYDYAPLFLPASRRMAREGFEDDGFRLTVTDLELAADGEGRERQVRVARAAATWGAGDEWIRLRYDQGCATYESAGTPDGSAIRSERRCDGEVGPPGPVLAGDRFAQASGFSRVGRIFPTFVVIERSGRWFLSPTRTVLGTLEEILEGLDPAEADAFVDRLGEVWEIYRPEPASEPAGPSPRAALGLGWS